ncbi:2-oxoglutarate dehydrogenase E1 component [Buchnera aphidicola (Mollitrichosiphum nigrofasciatum)]|uniref:2-oxoglutarate dehydrogenase E1 component n=1 Tax=Buchnera aphidicola TaxID=9 RepID=UPI0031B8AD3C
MKEKSNIIFKKKTWFTVFNQPYIDNLYHEYLNKKSSVANIWSKKFKKIIKKQKKIKKKKIKYYIKENAYKEIINTYRLHGYKIAKIDPLGLIKNSNIIEFDIIKKKYLNINENNFYLKKYFPKKKKIKKIFKKFNKIYCNTIGIEHGHLSKLKEKKWIQYQLEEKFYNYNLSIKKKKNLLKNLISAELLEKNLGNKYPGTKRFSLEGSETFIPILKTILNFAKKKNKKYVIIGMAHRGRLNVLINILKKKLSQVFYEFSNEYHNISYSDDVKYHKGYTRFIKIKNDDKIVVKLLYNPSHLEIINPVVSGTARAYIDKINNNVKVLPIMVHGDLAICGQGIVQETLNMSQTRGYSTGGSIHIIINNQIGFTTSNKKDIRSSKFCTDIAKMIDSPIFHINADEPESAIYIIKLALNFRDIFKKDVFINLVSYRRHGHNETDDPNITQPIMYKNIYKHKTVTQIYENLLINQKIVDNKYIAKIKKKYNTYFNTKYFIFLNISNKKLHFNSFLKENKKNFKKKKYKVKKKKLQKLAYKINNLPKNINIHLQVKKIYNSRIKMVLKKELFNWGAAENLAYAILLKKGFSCRLSGEDVQRGTFAHRHCAIYDQNTNKKYIPLQNITSKEKFNIWNSTLSEAAILAFEYGYSIVNHEKCLTIWEAQFGDFINGAQIVIDQFISSAETKWNQKSNLVIFLPHGYEGQGPEHSSARIERFLQLCAEKNMYICIPSNPAQIYHLLCRHMFKKIIKPLIIFSPKSLLRHPLAKSTFKDLLNKKFLNILVEEKKISNKLITRVVFCSGKIYYDLLIQKQKNKNYNISLIRIEQLYPFPKKQLKILLQLYKHINDFIWCQEEPRNQGSWNYIKNILLKIIPYTASLQYIGRPASSTTAVGSLYIHKKQQKKIINQIFSTINCEN